MSASVPKAPPASVESRATRRVLPFLAICAQVLGLVLLFRAFQLEERAFLRLSAAALAGFAVHYWLPFRLKEPWFVAVGAVTSVLLLGPVTTGLLFALGGAFFAVLSSDWPYRRKLAAMCGAAILLLLLRNASLPGVPPQFWPVCGALFMFRMVVYLYDLRHMKGRPDATAFLAYFFPLPNFYFLLFPVIDYQTQRRTYFQRDIHLMAQQGVWWMVRGTLQLLLYRLVYQLKVPFSSEEVVGPGTLLAGMLMTYLLYLRVSGQFHLIVGMLHLFGYDLPETNRKYLLAHSLTDFWRRINIYWKDFMVKVVYFPVYFRLRRSGDLRAQVVATVCVFVVTWVLHAYQSFWLRGNMLFSWPDSLFWGILGALVVVNLLLEQRKRRASAALDLRTRVERGVKIAATLLLISTLWSLWNATSVGEWLEIMAWWRRAGS